MVSRLVAIACLLVSVPALAQERPLLPEAPQGKPAAQSDFGIQSARALTAECNFIAKRPDLKTPQLRADLSDRIAKLREQAAMASASQMGGELAKQAVQGAVNSCDAVLVAAGGSFVKVGSSIPLQMRGTGKGHKQTAAGSDPEASQLEPWPPPVPTDFRTYTIADRTVGTVGQLANALVARIRGARERPLRFWSAPDGVAIVVPLEPIDRKAKPTKQFHTAASTPADNTLQGIASAIIEGFRRMLSEPIRDSRILLVVITTDEKAKHPDVAMTPATGERWANEGYMRPTIHRNTPLTGQHFVAVFSYEFHRSSVDDVALRRLREPGSHSVEKHLGATEIKFAGLIE